jgi:hypothetical protein
MPENTEMNKPRRLRDTEAKQGFSVSQCLCGLNGSAHSVTSASGEGGS